MDSLTFISRLSPRDQEDVKIHLSDPNNKTVEDKLQAIRNILMSNELFNLAERELNLAVPLKVNWKTEEAECFLRLITHATDRKLAESRLKGEYFAELSDFLMEKYPAAVDVYNNWKRRYDIANPSTKKEVEISVALEKILNFDSNKPEITLLMMGETGAGKSTFINSIVNYLSYKTLREAERSEIKILIKVVIEEALNTEQNGQPIILDPTVSKEQIGKNTENERIGDGESRTQEPTSYIFKYGPKGKEKRIRIIDTPGIGDTRGIKQEQQNMHKILSFLSKFKEINAFIFLFKGTTNRATSFLHFCFKELLVYLHTDAAPNIVFALSNTGTNSFGIGQAKNVLKALEADARKLSPGLNFNNLINYVQGIKPHDVQNTLNLNNIRATIFSLGKPMAEITRAQALNNLILERRHKEYELCIERGDASCVQIKQFVMEAVKLEKPRTVCTKCVTYQPVYYFEDEEYDEVVYSSHCHKECYLKGIIPLKYPNEELLQCWCIDNNTQCCHQCKRNCSYKFHMHVNYEQKFVEKMTSITLRNATEAINHLRKERAKLEDEAQLIRKCNIEFERFVRKYGMIVNNHNYGDFMDLLITVEKNKPSPNIKIIEDLEIRKRGVETALDRAKNLNFENEPVPTTVNRLYEMIEKLKRLEFGGKYLSDVCKYEVQKPIKAQTKEEIEIEYNEKVFNGRF